MPDDSLHFSRALLNEGWARNVRLGVRDGLCETIETDVVATGGDERHAITLPGLSNLHSHAFQRGMAGMAECRGPSEDSFWTWREVMYRFLDKLMPDDLAAIAAMAYVEMLETGFTRVGEFHYLHHAHDGTPFADPATMTQMIVEAVQQTGIALTHLPVFYAHSGFGGTEPGAGQRRFVHDIDGFARLIEGARAAVATLPDAIVGIAPHSLRAVTPDELRDLEALAGGGPIHIHIAEQVREVEDCLAWSGARPVEWLLDHASVDDRWCLVHATHMTDVETTAMARTGAVAGLCPITEANLGDGLFNLGHYLGSGGAFGVGSDSNVLIDASEELRLLEYGQRLASRGRNIVSHRPGSSTGRTLFDHALRGGARALGGEGGIAVGRALDIFSLDTSHPSLAAKDDDAILDGWIFAGGRTAIDCVWRRGRKLVSGGRHRSRSAIVARYRAAIDRLMK